MNDPDRDPFGKLAQMKRTTSCYRSSEKLVIFTRTHGIAGISDSCSDSCYKEDAKLSSPKSRTLNPSFDEPPWFCQAVQVWEVPLSDDLRVREHIGRVT